MLSFAKMVLERKCRRRRIKDELRMNVVCATLICEIYLPGGIAMDKIVVIINGKGGAGKDTLCEAAAKHYRVKNVSSIDPIKAIAAQHGWNGEKDDKARKFLSDLKRAFTEYNDLPNHWLEEQASEFAAGDDEVLFVHIREGSQIDDFKRRVKGRYITLLIRSSRTETTYGNASDDEVENYPYDYVYQNDKPLSEAEEDFLTFLREVFSREGLISH